MANEGKQFEADWKASSPKSAFVYRLKDSAATYYGGNDALSFSIDNICDFILYRQPRIYLVELKTIQTPSIPLEKIFGKFDRDKGRYKKIKHIQDMAAAQVGHEGIAASVVINFRCVNRTWAIAATSVLEYMATEERKSIPWQWCAVHGYEIEQHIAKVHWRYDVDGYMKGI